MQVDVVAGSGVILPNAVVPAANVVVGPLRLAHDPVAIKRRGVRRLVQPIIAVKWDVIGCAKTLGKDVDSVDRGIVRHLPPVPGRAVDTTRFGDNKVFVLRKSRMEEETWTEN